MKKIPKIVKIAIYCALAIVLIIFPMIAKSRYQVHIINMVGIYILLSLGLNIAMGYAGQFNLAMGALWAIGAYTAGLLNTRLGFPLWITLPLSVIAGGVVGGFVGLPSLKVRAHYLSIVTIGLNEIINIILVNETNFTGGVDGVSRIKMPTFFSIPINTDEKYYYIILFFVIIAFLLARQILSGRVGRNFRALRDDYKTAPAMGVNAGAYKILAFIISGCFAGLAGALYAHLNTYISPDIFEHKTTLFIMTMTMIGGMGNLYGSLVGSFLLPVLQEYLRAIQEWQFVVYGIAIMLVVLFMPGGLMQIVNRVKPLLLKIPKSLRRKGKGDLDMEEKSNVS
jgi:branched-chain amino acid transport system permease protein